MREGKFVSISVREGNLLSLQEGILVHGCNCLGVMGAGLALLIRNQWPQVFDVYQQVHERQGLKLGDVQAVCHPGLIPHSQHAASVIPLFATATELPLRLVVVNAMTQRGVRQLPGQKVVNYDAVFAAFARIRLLAKELSTPVHFPLIGCGLAGGRWDEVAPLIEAALGPDVEKVLWTLPGAHR